LLLAAREPPARWAIRLADLRSRLLAAPAVAVEAPDDALLGAVMVKLFADRQLRISEDLIAYLLPRIERSFAAAREIVATLDEAALASQRAVTVRLARDILNRDRDPDRG
jgi:chromosomal replication initiation ATPase DnaA